MLSTSELIQFIKRAPKYQPIPIAKTDPPELKAYLRARNRQCKRTDLSRYLSFERFDGASVLDLGCNIGYFGFVDNAAPAFYRGVDSDETCIDAARALAAFRGYSHITFECDTVQDFVNHQRHDVKYDVVLYLSLHHHMIGMDSSEELRHARRLLMQISNLAQVMYFDMGQKDEPTNPSRAVWHDKLPDMKPLDFIKSHVLDNSRYTQYEVLEGSKVSGFQRLLFRFWS